ncbi:ABC transporter permease [Raoultella sp. WB_B2P2-3]|uniref:ABC transporter permease n=1 Tax=Raoultella scottii TaxID=3040937 RepID=A0ABU8Z1S2_9ENTR
MSQISGRKVAFSRRWRAAALPLGLLLLWAALSHARVMNPDVLVSPVQVVHTLWQSLDDGSLPLAIIATVVRALAGLLIGGMAGLALGMLLGTHRLCHRLFSPTFNGLQQIALFAWIPLLSAWVGTGEGLKITEIALGAFFPMLLSTREGCRHVAEKYREVGYLLEFNAIQILTRITLPAALPAIVSGLETAFTIAWLGTIGTEYLVGTGYVNGLGDGLGIYLAAARMYGDMDKVIVGVLTLAVIGILLNRAIALLSRRITPWLTH